MSTRSHMIARSLTLLLCCGLATPLAAQQPDQQPTIKDQAASAHLMEDAEQIASKVANIRGLSLLKPMKKGVKTREELRKTLLEKIAMEYTDDALKDEADVLKALDVFAQDVDYKKLILDVLTEQIAGFYDPQTKELYIMQGLPASLQRSTMAHEIFHVIQDQHFNILGMQAPFKNSEHSDFQLARSALLEGDATVLMMDFSLYESNTLPMPNARSIVETPFIAASLKAMKSQDLSAMERLAGSKKTKTPTSGAMQNAPRFIKELLLFPYIAGLRFVALARQGRQWTDINAMYAKAPVSTEQILHPERYFSGDEPIFLELLPQVPGSTKIYDNVMGELQMRLILQTQCVDPVRSKAKPIQIDVSQATTGWDGDRLFGFRDAKGNIITVHLSVWDSPREAAEYYNAMKASMLRRKISPKKSEIQYKHGQATLIAHKSKQSYIEQWGDLVLSVEGANQSPQAATVVGIRESVWKSLKRTPLKQVIAARSATAAPKKTP